jgi:hypothetical protein
MDPIVQPLQLKTVAQAVQAVQAAQAAESTFYVYFSRNNL